MGTFNDDSINWRQINEEARRKERNRIAAVFSIAFVGLLAIIVAMAGCRVPPTGVVSKVIDCSTETVQKNWPTAIGPVNDCLTRDEGEDWTRCLDLVPAAVNVGVDVLACVLREQRATFADSARANPFDDRSKRAAKRADAYMDAKGWTYAP